MNAAEIDRILAAAAPEGWVLEPEAKCLLAAAGIAVPRSTWAPGPDEAAAFAAGVKRRRRRTRSTGSPMERLCGAAPPAATSIEQRDRREREDEHFMRFIEIAGSQ